MAAETSQSYLQQLTALCRRATTAVVLAAPFAKADILRQLIEAVDRDADVTVVTRWHADEVAAQVSDLEVWPLLRKRAKSRLLLQQRLHAKYYRADQECLTGSANLTAAALNGSDLGNLELLIHMSASDPQLQGFEEGLVSGTLLVDDGLYNLFSTLVAELSQIPTPAVEQVTVTQVESNWYPEFRTPNDLYRMYQGSGDYSAAVLNAARHDLLVLAPPPRLGRDAFMAAIAIALRSTDLIRDLDAFLGTEERRFGELQDWVSHWIGKTDDDGRSTQCLIRWLMTFLSDRYRYRRPGYSELLSRRFQEDEPSLGGVL